MADEKVTIKYETEYDGKGAKTAAADAQKVADTAKSAGDAAKKAGAEGQTGFAAMAAGAAKVGAALVAAKGVVDFFAQSVREYQEHARNVNMLAAAFDNVGYTASGAMQQALAFADEMERSTGLDGELFIKGQRALANYGVVGAQAQEAIRAAFALSANQGIAFESALQLLTRAAAGSTATLTRYGVVLGDNVKEGQEFEAAVKQINEQFGPSAQAAMSDTTAKMGALREAWGGFKEIVGQGLNEGLAPVVEWLTDAVLFLQKAFTAWGNSWDYTIGLIQTGIAGLRSLFLNFADVALSAFGKIVEIGNKLHLIPDGVAEAVKGAEEWISRAADSAEQETAEELVNNYLKSHNDESYMYELAGLTPREFYLYKVTGIYPCESYYGIAATKLMPLSTLVEMKLEQKEKKRKKRAQKQTAENSIAPARILARDQKKVRKEKQKWHCAKETAEKQLRFLEGLEEQIKEAVKHYAKAGQEIRDKLCRAETWRETWPYDYVTQMKGMY